MKKGALNPPKRREETAEPGFNQGDVLRAVLIVVMGFWVFSPALRGDWLWDDDFLISGNPVVHAPGGLWRIWFEPGCMIDYQPLKFSVVWLQWQLFGDNTLGYHLTNIVLHVIGALLVWRLFSKFGLRLAWLGGLIFALHPVMVESVVWMAELKNTLSLPPFLLAVCAYIDYDRRGKRKDYFWALGLFLAAMLCKTTMVMFPVVILLYAGWKRGRLGRNDLESSAPFFAVSIVMGIITVWFLQHHAMGNQPIPLGNFFSRLTLAGLSTAFYFSKCVLPLGLLPIYPKWPVNPSSLLQLLPWPVMLGVIAWCWNNRKTWGRHALLGLGFFLINLLPFVGFTAASYMNFTWVMDHILYLPIIGLIGLLVAVLGQVDGQLSTRIRPCWIGVGVGIMALLAFESHWYAGLFINQKTLWTYVLQRNPEAWPARHNLGTILADMGRLPEAIEQFEIAIQLNPHNADTHNSLGRVFQRQHRTSEATEQFQIALTINPNDTRAHNSLGEMMAEAKRYPEAMKQFNEALQADPDDVAALENRSHLGRIVGQFDGALSDLDHAIKLAPDSAQPYLNRGVMRRTRGDFDPALSDLREFLKLAPKDPNADYARLWIWLIRTWQGQKADADTELTSALSQNWNASSKDLVSQEARFLLGQISETELLAAAVSTDTDQDQGRHCEVGYYVGMKRLLAGDKIAALDDFHKCVATGKTDYFEYTLAQGQLNVLNAR